MYDGFALLGQDYLSEEVSDLIRIGRLLFAAAIAFFGVQCLLSATQAGGPVAGPPWTQTHVGIAWLVGIGLIAAAGCVVSGWQGRMAAVLLGAGMLVWALIVLVPGLVMHLHNPDGWTTTFEILGMSGGAFVIAATFPERVQGGKATSNRLSEVLIEVGRYLFAISLVVFAVQHFMYARFITGLIPGWIPWHLFWAEFVGVAFAAVAVSLVTGKMVRVISTLLGVMFLLWVMVLHAPRVLASPRNGNELTSLLVALAMGGAALVLAESLSGD